MSEKQKGERFDGRRAALIAGGITAFLFIFRPFGISINTWLEALILLGFAPLNFIAIMSVHEIRVLNGPPRAVLASIFIALANVIYALFWQSSAQIIPITLQVALVAGLVIAAVATWNRLRTQSYEIIDLKSKLELSDKLITIKGESESEILRIPAESLLYAKAQGNYAEVHYLSGDESETTLVRLTLAGLQSQAGTALVRCHRSYLVNLRAARRLVSSNSGMHTELINGTAIPVSRSYRDAIRAAAQN